ncbi:hypothetical protein B296_00039798 [Ensete ventricosum]|uniref:Cation-transporting P-type ATPase C-terminal domain-containing protein n=1 Tax=Ensete ventricosum TaxID=4639 RepID=A0A426ZS45_ENSVE|nr:hypothetical protein B296_00039798 [Ensete ventricosum]
MVTGDNLQTAKAIALECGILTDANASEPTLIEGRTFRMKTDAERNAIVEQITVMGRSSPSDKLLLVQALRRRDHVVAVTGDGTNDAPALHEGLVSIAAPSLLCYHHLPLVLIIEFLGKFTSTVRLNWKLWLVSIAIAFLRFIVLYEHRFCFIKSIEIVFLLQKSFALFEKSIDAKQPSPTRGIDMKALEDDQSKSTSSEEVEHCVTPRSEQLEAKPPLVCPPAPRKPRPAKRKLGPPPNGYHPVPTDLASVFVPLLCPANKKVRVG